MASPPPPPAAPDSAPDAAPPRESPLFWGFAVAVKFPGQPPTLRWRWHRLAILAAALAAAGYFAVAGFLFYFYRYQRNFDAIRPAEVLAWPGWIFQRDDFRRRMGDYFIEKAKEALAAGQFLEAFNYLRNGVSRSPGNTEGRVLLAEFFEFGMNRVDLAADLMRGGLPFNVRNADYLRRFLALLLRHQRDDEVRALATELLPPPESLPPPLLPEGAPNPDFVYYQLLAFAAAQSNVFRGSYDAAETLLDQYQLAQTHDGVILSSQIYWERGRRETAAYMLEQAAERFPESDTVYIQLIRAYRELGDLRKAQQYGILRGASNPLNPAPRVELLYVYHESGNSDRVAAEVESMLRQYAKEEKTLLEVANFAAEAGLVDTAWRLYRHALERNFDLSTFALLVIEANVVAGRYADALAFAEELAREEPVWLASRRSLFNSLRSVACLGAGQVDLGKVYLQEFLTSTNIHVKTLLAVSRRLQGLGYASDSRRVLRVACERNPQNQAALSELILVEMQLGTPEDLPELVARILEMRRPSLELLQTAYQTLGKDRYLFSRDRDLVLNRIQDILAATAGKPI